MPDIKKLTPLSFSLISEFDKERESQAGEKITVDPVVSEVATWYEKLRNSMDIREDDVVLRAAIERILKRRLLLGGTGETIAQPLVRELAWARYFEDGSYSEALVEKVKNTINLYFSLQDKINAKHRINKNLVSEWVMHLLSSEIEHILSPNREKELVLSYMFQTYKNQIDITDDTKETKDAQVFIAVRKAFAKEDTPLLRYQLFLQLFGRLNPENIEKISDHFPQGIKQIEYQFNYPLKQRIYTYIKKQTIPFYILDDVMRENKGKNHQLFSNYENLKVAVYSACSYRYKNIRAKVQRAIIRGVIFILITKAIFALGIEGTFENLVYGEVYWNSILLNTTIPPLLMVFVGLMIKTPGKANTQKIFEKLTSILFENQGSISQPLFLKRSSTTVNPLLQSIFVVLWLVAFGLTFGVIIYILTALHFNLISQGIFVFFITIVSFISYRINQTAHMYTLEGEKQSLKSVLFDFLFLPFIHVGRNLTENISRLNIIILFFDLIIETPFKVIFSFFEQWFLYLRTQREKLG